MKKQECFPVGCVPPERYRTGGGLCLGVSVQEGLCLGGLCLGGLCSGVYVWGVSVQGVSVQGVSVWGSLSRGVSVGSLSRGLCSGGLCLGPSVPRGLPDRDPQGWRPPGQRPRPPSLWTDKHL